MENEITELRKRMKRFYESLSLKDYERIVIDYPDIPWENSEDPRNHHFRTVNKEQRVVIYRKAS